MNAIELAETLEHNWPCSSQQPHQAAAMLRKQAVRVEQLERENAELKAKMESMTKVKNFVEWGGL